MKVYMIVTNDILEIPVKEVVGGIAAAEFLGMKRKTFHTYMMKGFPRKHKYKAVVIKEMQFEDKKERNHYHGKKYRMKHDRTEYFKEYWRKKSERIRHERDLQNEAV